jgi:hypothetical protein
MESNSSTIRPRIARGWVAVAFCLLCPGCDEAATGPSPAAPPAGVTHVIPESPEAAPTWNPFEDDVKSVDPASALRFIDVTRTSGVEFITYGSPSPEHYMTEQNGSGVAVFDLDADGWLDLFLANSSHPDRPAEQVAATHGLYRSLGEWSFEDVAASAGVAETGYGMGCAAGDFNSDGFTDLLLAGYDRNRLWENNGDGTLSEVELPVSPFPDRWSTSAAFADLDADGFLDLYVTNYVDYKFEDGACFTQHQPHPVMIPCGPLGRTGQPDSLLRNNANGTFDDVSEDAGIGQFRGKGLGVSIEDFNEDGLLDIYVANDTTENLLFENEGEFRFRESGLINGVAFGADGRARSGMGVACGDCNGDGHFDLLVTNFQHEPYDLFVGSGDSGFVPRNSEMGLDRVTRPMLGFGVCFGDFDLDADLDLFVANGHVWDLSTLNLDYDYEMTSQLLLNDRGQRFLDVSSISGDWLRMSRVGRATAIGDLDNDGDEDLVVTSLSSPVALLRNDSTTAKGSVSIQLIGIDAARDPRGVRVDMQLAGRWVTRRVASGDSFQAACDSRVLFATGNLARIDTIRIHWPGRDVEEWFDIPVSRRLTVIEGQFAISGP